LSVDGALPHFRLTDLRAIFSNSSLRDASLCDNHTARLDRWRLANK
jgi:hypothetical protein